MAIIRVLLLIIGVLCGLCGLPAAAQEKPTLTLVADYWCPYNCQPGSEFPGFMVELARRAFAPEGYRVRYKLVPWRRALQAVDNGRYTAAIGASHVEAPGFVFPAMEQARMGNGLWTTADSDWHYTDLRSLEGKRIAVMGGYGYGPKVDAFLDDPDHQRWITRLYGDHPLERGVRLLRRGRVDVLLEDENVVRYYRDNHDMQAELRLAGRVQPQLRHANVFIAFSPALPESQQLAEILSRATQRLRASGELASILKSYGLKDWR